MNSTLISQSEPSFAVPSPVEGDPVSRGESHASEDTPMELEHFIPIRRSDLAVLLADEPGLSLELQEKFRQLCRMLESVVHFEYHQHLEAIKDLYANFDPDADTRRPKPLSPEQKDALMHALFEKFTAVMERANYRRMRRKQIEEAADTLGDWGVRLTVDFSIFRQLEVYVRGSDTEKRVRRPWTRLFMKKEVDVPVHQRLMLIFRVKDVKGMANTIDPETIYIKVFKKIPKADIDLLLPGSRVKMSGLDMGRIWLPTISGLGVTGFKLAVTTAVMNPVTAIPLIIGTIGYGVKSFFGYLRAKDKHHYTLTKSLYFQNLGNNSGVINRLLDEAEEQECREAMLAYFFLWNRAGGEAWSEEYLDRQVEDWFGDRVGLQVDFEVDDALAKLTRMGLATEKDGRYQVVGIDEALVKLDFTWDNYFRYANPNQQSVD